MAMKTLVTTNMTTNCQNLTANNKLFYYCNDRGKSFKRKPYNLFNS